MLPNFFSAPLPSPVRLALLAVTVLLLTGCQSLAPRPYIALDDIAQMSREGKSGAEIIAMLEARRLPLQLTGSQLGGLKQQGVPDEVLDYLLDAYTRNIRYQARLDAEPYWWHHPFYLRAPQVIVVQQPRR